MWNKDRCPVGNTCPFIDDVLDFLKNIENLEDSDYKWIKKQLENLRTQNSALRDWGNDEQNKVNELKSEAEKAERKISDLESTVSDFEERIKELKAEIKELETQSIE